MENLPPLGRGIQEVLLPTYEIYAPILSTNSGEAITATARETFAYGSHPRLQLDLYTPSSSAPKPPAGKSRPILVFAYGGGLVNGDKVLDSVPGGLIYKNLGYFFAEKLGFDTIIMDYRLLDHGAKFPSGGEDLAGVLDWIEKRFGGAGKREVFLMGNSAGGIHVFSWLFGEQFQESRKKFIKAPKDITVAGVVGLGAPYHFEPINPAMQTILTTFYGKRIQQDSSLELMKATAERGELRGTWPRILVLDSELDPPEILQTSQDLIEEAKKIGGLDLTHLTMKGHNHISPPLALGTGIEKEEEWGYYLGKWSKAVV